MFTVTNFTIKKPLNGPEYKFKIGDEFDLEDETCPLTAEDVGRMLDVGYCVFTDPEAQAEFEAERAERQAAEAAEAQAARDAEFEEAEAARKEQRAAQEKAEQKATEKQNAKAAEDNAVSEERAAAKDPGRAKTGAAARKKADDEDESKAGRRGKKPAQDQATDAGASNAENR